MEILKTSRGFKLYQRRYAGEIIKRFKMEECTPTTTPIEANIKLEKGEKEEKVDFP